MCLQCEAVKLPDGNKKNRYLAVLFSCFNNIISFPDDGLNSRRFSFIQKFTDKILGTIFYEMAASREVAVMQYVVRQQYLNFETLLKKGYPLIWDKNAQKCDFLSHIERINKTHKQIKQSAYVFFYMERYFSSLFARNATNPPFTLRVTVKGDKRAKLTSFHDKKGGE